MYCNSSVQFFDYSFIGKIHVLSMLLEIEYLKYTTYDIL